MLIFFFFFFCRSAKKLVAIKFYVCSCLFGRFAYLLCIKEHCRLPVIESKLRNSEWCTFVYCSQDFICACYRCLFSIPKVKKFDVDNVIDNMRKICNHYLGNSYVSRVTKQSAKTCFESAQPYLKMEECYSNVESEDIDMFCFKSLKHIVVCHNLLLDDIYVLVV